MAVYRRRTVTTATDTLPDTSRASTGADDALEVVLAFRSLDDYRAMGEDIDAARKQLDLPSWSTPTEVIAAALGSVAAT